MVKVFSRHFCEIFRNTFFPEHLRVTVSKIKTDYFIWAILSEELFLRKMILSCIIKENLMLWLRNSEKILPSPNDF